MVDINELEKQILEEYVINGGKVMLVSGTPIKEDLDNIYDLCWDFGLEKQKGVVIETKSEKYVYGQPYSLLPEIHENDITQPLIDENRRVIMPIAQGMTVREEMPDNYLISELLTVDETTYSKLKGINIENYDREEGDIDGPFCMTALVEMKDTDGKIVILSSDFFCDNEFNANSAGANMDFMIRPRPPSIRGCLPARCI